MIVKAGCSEFWNKNFMHIFLALNCTCNFHCSYCCNQNTRKKYPKVFPKERIVGFLDEVFLLNKEEYIFTLVGGEPSIYPHLRDFYWEVDKRNEKKTVTMYTNGSRLPFVQEIMEQTFSINHKIIVSMHLEQKNADEYLSSLSRFAFPQNSIVKILLKPGSLDFVLDLKNTVSGYGYTMDIEPIGIKGNIHPDYTVEELDFLRHQNNFMEFFNTYQINGGMHTECFNYFDYFSNHEKINYSGMQCSAGKNFLRIMPDGEVTFCHKDWSKSHFSVLEHSLQEYPYLHQTVTCQAVRCACPETVALPKWRI